MAFRIKRGDTVLVLSGRDKGRRGQVLDVFPDKNKAVVEGVNIVHRHTKQASAERPGGIIETPAPMNMSKLMLVDPKTGTAGRIRVDVDDKGNKIRRSKRTNNEI